MKFENLIQCVIILIDYKWLSYKVNCVALQLSKWVTNDYLMKLSYEVENVHSSFFTNCKRAAEIACLAREMSLFLFGSPPLSLYFAFSPSRSHLFILIEYLTAWIRLWTGHVSHLSFSSLPFIFERLTQFSGSLSLYVIRIVSLASLFSEMHLFNLLTRALNIKILQLTFHMSNCNDFVTIYVGKRSNICPKGAPFRCLRFLLSHFTTFICDRDAQEGRFGK